MLGPYTPIDVQHFPADAIATGDLIRWNESVLQKIADRSFGGVNTLDTPGNFYGLVSRNEVGAFMLAQSKAYRVLIDAPNVSLNVFPNMVAYNFPTAWLYDSMVRRRGTRAERVHVVFRALANFTNIGASAQLTVSSAVFNSTRTGIPGTGPN